MIADLFIGYSEVISQQKPHMRTSSTVTRRYQASTAAAKFQVSLLELMEKMER